MGPPQHRRARSADPRERPRVGRAVHFQASARQKTANFERGSSCQWARRRAGPRLGGLPVAAPGPRRAFPLAAESTRSRSVPVAVHYCIYSQPRAAFPSVSPRLAPPATLQPSPSEQRREPRCAGAGCGGPRAEDGQAVVEIRDDSGTHRLRSVRSARPTPTELDNLK
jgi:hypothetical protein